MKPKTSLNKRLKKLQIVSSSELELIMGNRSAISEAVKKGKIQRIGSGFYSASNLDPNTALLLTVGRFFPQAVISGISALAFYGLSDEQTNKVTVDIKRGTSLRNQILQIHRVMPKFMMGIEEKKIKRDQNSNLQ